MAITRQRKARELRTGHVRVGRRAKRAVPVVFAGHLHRRHSRQINPSRRVHRVDSAVAACMVEAPMRRLDDRCLPRVPCVIKGSSTAASTWKVGVPCQYQTAAEQGIEADGCPGSGGPWPHSTPPAPSVSVSSLPTFGKPTMDAPNDEPSHVLRRAETQDAATERVESLRYDPDDAGLYPRR